MRTSAVVATSNTRHWPGVDAAANRGRAEIVVAAGNAMEDLMNARLSMGALLLCDYSGNSPTRVAGSRYSEQTSIAVNCEDSDAGEQTVRE
jgi:hypothetical protein